MLPLLMACTTSVDLSDSLVELGNPWEQRFTGEWAYARNPWDLLAFDGRLYIGGGNSSNVGLAANAGPVPILSWDGADFIDEGEVDEEQIDRILELDERLVIPGHDPHSADWGEGFFYRLEGDGSWSQNPVPEVIHVYDMASFEGQWFAGLGATSAAALAVSEDLGESWTVHSPEGFRIHALLQVAETLFTTDVFNSDLNFVVPAHEWTGEGVRARDDLDHQALFPGAELGLDEAKVVSPVSVGSSAAWIGSRVHNDHQHRPFGLYVARSLAEGAVDVVEVPLDGVPWDLLVYKHRAYVLVAEPGVVRVLRSRDLERFEEVGWFETTDFVRSFAPMGEDLIFGVGAVLDEDEQIPERNGALMLAEGVL